MEGVQCVVCCSTYNWCANIPKVAQCGHTICKTCFDSIIDDTRLCPLCRRKVTSTGTCDSNHIVNGVATEYRNNFALLRLIGCNTSCKNDVKVDKSIELKYTNLFSESKHSTKIVEIDNFFSNGNNNLINYNVKLFPLFFNSTNETSVCVNDQFMNLLKNEINEQNSIKCKYDDLLAAVESEIVPLSEWLGESEDDSAMIWTDICKTFDQFTKRDELQKKKEEQRRKKKNKKLLKTAPKVAESTDPGNTQLITDLYREILSAKEDPCMFYTTDQGGVRWWGQVVEREEDYYLREMALQKPHEEAIIIPIASIEPMFNNFFVTMFLELKFKDEEEPRIVHLRIHKDYITNVLQETTMGLGHQSPLIAPENQSPTFDVYEKEESAVCLNIKNHSIFTQINIKESEKEVQYVMKKGFVFLEAGGFEINLTDQRAFSCHPIGKVTRGVYHLEKAGIETFNGNPPEVLSSGIVLLYNDEDPEKIKSKFESELLPRFIDDRNKFDIFDEMNEDDEKLLTLFD